MVNNSSLFLWIEVKIIGNEVLGGKLNYFIKGLIILVKVGIVFN